MPGKHLFACCKAHNRIYEKHERQIWREIQKAAAARRITLNVSDVCSTIGISRRAFYIHYHNLNDARQQQEKDLCEKFMARIHRRMQREVIFTTMLAFLKEHRSYFAASFQHQDLYVLTLMLDSLRPFLTPVATSDKTYTVYRSELKGIIQAWAVEEKFSRQKIEAYAKALTYRRVMRFEV